MAPRKAATAPTIQLHRTSEGEPSWPARNPVLVKMPVPIMFDTTSAVALTTPSWRRSAGFEDAKLYSSWWDSIRIRSLQAIDSEVVHGSFIRFQAEPELPNVNKNRRG